MALAYKVDFRAYTALCEANYLKVMRLFSGEHDFYSYQVELPSDERGVITFHVTQRCKYTTMLTITKKQEASWLPNISFNVRLYHDAKMLEIMTFQQQKIAKIRYEYPNKQMFQQNEKVQHQTFLAECLAYCLKYGLSDVELDVV